MFAKNVARKKLRNFGKKKALFFYAEGVVEMETLIICGKAILYTLTLCVCAYTVTITYKEIVKELKKK